MAERANGGVNEGLEHGFQLGAIRIEPLAGEISGPVGSEKLDPKVMDVLVFMARHAGQVVSREELLARLWPGAVVTDDALTRCFYELRRHLRSAGGNEEYGAAIETLPKRGYRLHGKVTPIPTPRSRPGAGPHKWWIRGLAIAVAVILLWVLGRFTFEPEPGSPPAEVAQISIAVLPFADMSEGQDQGYFSDGITEEILNRLAQSSDLRVIARTSSFALRDQLLDVTEISKKLGVTHVLEGSVRKSGDRVRVTAQLITASDSSHAWSNTFDRGLGDVFAIQDEIAASVAAALQVTLEGGNPKAPRPTNIEAFEKFAQGEFFYYRRAPGDVQRAVKYYEEAVAIDPRYARTWAALAGAYSILAWSEQGVDKELQRRQGEAARKAVELEPGLAVAHARLGQYYAETMDEEKGREHFRRARELDPENPMLLAYASEQAFERGDVDEAIAIQRRMVARDPLNSLLRGNMAVILFAGGRLDEALSEYRRVLEQNPSIGLNTEIEIPRILIMQGHLDEARTAIAHYPEGRYRDHVLALLFKAPGGRAEADAALNRLIAQQAEVGGSDSYDGDIMDSIRLAEVQAFRGMNDAAFRSLEEKKVQLEGRWGSGSQVVWYFTHEARVAPFLKPLHTDPRWTSLTAFAD